MSGESHVRFCSSEPAMTTGPAPRPEQMIEVPIPAQPQQSSSLTSAPSSSESSGPPYVGRDVEVHEPDLVGLRDDLGCVGLVLVVLGRLRPDLLLGKLARELSQRLLLVRERERRARRGGVLDYSHGVAPR